MNRFLRVFVSGMLAGLCISMGGAVFLSLDSKIAGALFFTVGLFAVCTCGFHLFTGKVCTVFQRDKSYASELPFIWLGNLAGAWCTALLLSFTRVGHVLREKAAALCETKLGDSLGSLFVLGIFCNILIYLAVDGFANNPHQLGKYLALFFGVTVFILCGFEHCVADMFYFSMAGMWSLKTLGRLLLITAGNVLGGVLLPTARAFTAGKEKA